jgi:hypothetical protein
MAENSPIPTDNPYTPPGSPLHEQGTLAVSRITAPVRCPHCGTMANHPLISAHRERMGCRNIVLFLVTGVFFYLLWAAQLPRPFGCASCGKLFHARTPGAKVALGVLICLVVLVAGVLSWQLAK